MVKEQLLQLSRMTLDLVQSSEQYECFPYYEVHVFACHFHVNAAERWDSGWSPDWATPRFLITLHRLRAQRPKRRWPILVL